MRDAPKKKIIPIGHSELDAKTHVAFGRALKEVVLASSKKIALIASGDLSHCLSSAAPGGYAKQGPAFDEKFRRALQDGSLSRLLSMKTEMVQGAVQCAYQPALMMLGALDGMGWSANELAYEAPFGVGHATIQFHWGWR